MNERDHGAGDDSRTLQRFVHWWYCATIQSPPDSLEQIAARECESVDTIANGIAEATALLNQIEPAVNRGRLDLTELIPSQIDPVRIVMALELIPEIPDSMRRVLKAVVREVLTQEEIAEVKVFLKRHRPH